MYFSLVLYSPSFSYLMKKTLFCSVLVLAAIGLWSFYPHATNEGKSQYLFLISDLTLFPEQQHNVGLTTIEPDGSFHTEELPENLDSYITKEKVTATITSQITDNIYINRRNRYARNLLLQRELLKIKELTEQGWTLTATVPDKSGVRYVFQKPALQ
jgi:hypothetical protein